MCSLPKKIKLALIGVIESELDSPSMASSSIISRVVQRKSKKPVLLTLQSQMREKHVRMPLFYEKWVFQYLETDFYTHFRMGKATFGKLVEEVAKVEESQKRSQPHYGGRLPVPLDKGMLITVWYLAKGNSFATISDRFDVTSSTVSVITSKCISWLLHLTKKYICWPNAQEAHLLSCEFFRVGSYPNVIGAIDGCHIPLIVPSEQHDSYANRKQQHSIIVQGVCTANKIFTNVFVGFPGSAHDARVLKNSGLYKALLLKGELSFFFDKYHLIGDSAYPCKTWLMKPYRDTGRLSRSQSKHNKSLSATRVAIENTFGIFKGRWKILNLVNCKTVEKAVDVVTACTVLHNFCLLHRDNFEADVADEDIISDDQNIREMSDESAGIRKRDLICQQWFSQ